MTLSGTIITFLYCLLHLCFQMISLYKDPKGVKVFDRRAPTSSSASTNMTIASTSEKQLSKPLVVQVTTRTTADTT